MRESARLPGHPVRAAATRQVQECLFSVPRTRFARSSRMAGEFSDLTLTPFRPFAKMANTISRERQTISFPFVPRKLTSESIRSPSEDRSQEEDHWRATIPSRQESNPHLRYYTLARIIQGQIWVANEAKFMRAIFMEPRIHWFQVPDIYRCILWCMITMIMATSISRARKWDHNF